MSRKLDVMVKQYLTYMAEKNYSETTIHMRRVYLGYFMDWCKDRSLFHVQEVTKPVLDRYLRHVYRHRTPQGKPLRMSSIYVRLTPLRVFFSWLSKNNFMLFNPASDLEFPRLEQRLPEKILSDVEVENVLSQTDTNTFTGIRDRAILETFYSTGIRRLELAKLQLYDLDRDRGLLMVRQGKGRKDRVIPIGDRALLWIELYLSDVRPLYITSLSEGPLFVSKLGEGMKVSTISEVGKRYLRKAEIKKGSCHIFRHTMATLMLENGADIRFIQQMLGHADLSSTQIYTHVAIGKLKEVHEKTHPAKLKESKPEKS